jgi:hypothetical protein
MEHGSVVYVHRVGCTSCGFIFAGYLDNLGDGTGVVSCPKCEARVVQALPTHYVEQVPLPGHGPPSTRHIHVSHHPGLYSQPKRYPRLDLKDLLRVGYRPVKALETLYLSTNLQRGLSLVVIFSLLSAVVGTLFTAGAGTIFGYDTGDALLLGLRGFASWIVTLFAFLIFAVVAAVVAKAVYGGRGEKSATIMLVGYCFPAYVLVNFVLLVIFAVGFQGLDLTDVTSWEAAAKDQAFLAATALVLIAIIGLAWLLWIVSRAIGVANDISGSESLLTTIIAAIAAALVYVLAGAAIRLPMGLSL